MRLPLLYLRTAIVLIGPFWLLLRTETVFSQTETTATGVLVSPVELAEIKAKADQGLEPYRQNLQEFLSFIDSLMATSSEWQDLSGEVIVYERSSSSPIQLSSIGAKLVYGTALAWHLTGGEKYAQKSRSLILDLTDTYGYRNDAEPRFHWGAQGILNLARGGTPYMYAADLLEPWSGWSREDKLSYQRWLRDVMYPKVAWASRWRKNNWGVAGSFSAALIAWYLMEHPHWKLEEISPKPRTLSPGEAFDAHNRYQIGRLLTTDEWKMDGKVALWGILPNGAIPEEIRRGDDPIDGDHLATDGSGTHYTMTFIEHLTAHAAFLHRQGDNRLFDHVAADGSGSLLQAYLFVIDNPIRSHCFTPNRINALYLAYDYYRHPAMLNALDTCGPGNISGQRLALFAKLTRPVVHK
ncbi:alginate lyase family protein [Cyclobacterium xiamenense]|uniref:alginate lyase family protein n=1 Tax=Cyclobacterium xiamenense TaxID=1297121 RepID=UPI0012B7CAC3|nr:alginate lyase family protein [Cyclobacterium xiamenense]